MTAGISTIEPLSITLGSLSGPTYKSIDYIEWNDIPSFAVLTGLNGSGKTQFLQALAYKLSGAAQHNPNYQKLNSVQLSLTNSIGPDEISYLPSEANIFRVDSTTISNFQNAKHRFVQQLSGNQSNIEQAILHARLRKKYGISISQNPNAEQLAKLPDDFMFMLEYGEVSAGLSHVFFGYQVRLAQSLLKQHNGGEIETLGEPPWTFVNNALAAAEFSYQIMPPAADLMAPYQVKLKSKDGGSTLEFNDLSSGEKTILRTILWLYNSKHNGIFPKLFLLDEPDAHLHPSMTRQFIDVVKNVLVDHYNVRVILTTHSPSTVALSPDNSIFVMSKDQPRIRRPSSKADAIGLLTSGLVIVSAGTKYIFVEDEDDVTFFESVRDVLSDLGPSRDSMALKPAPSLVFMPASIGKSTSKSSGGKSVVKQWIDKFDSAPLDQMFRGLIDLDNGNTAGSRISVIGRHSIENYQLDPFVVFGALVESQNTPAINGVALTAGDEHLVRELDAPVLQRIVDYVRQQVEPHLGTLTANEGSPVSVKFTNQKIVSYPAWMLTRRGHDLLPIYQAVFGQREITPPRLLRSFRRIRLVPIELASIMIDMQRP